MSNAPHRRPFITAVYSGKGGVGKTTLVAGLSATAGTLYPGQVLALDVDPRQASLGVHAAITAKRNDPHYECRADTNPEHLRMLGHVSLPLIFVDLPGNLDRRDLFAPVAAEANVLLIPTSDSGLDMQQTIATYRYVLDVAKNERPTDRPPLHIRVVINNMDAQYPARIAKMRGTLAKRAVPVLDTAVNYRRALANCVRDGVPITDYTEPGAGLAKLQLYELLQELMRLNREAVNA